MFACHKNRNKIIISLLYITYGTRLTFIFVLFISFAISLLLLCHSLHQQQNFHAKLYLCLMFIFFLNHFYLVLLSQWKAHASKLKMAFIQCCVCVFISREIVKDSRWRWGVTLWARLSVCLWLHSISLKLHSCWHFSFHLSHCRMHKMCQ